MVAAPGRGNEQRDGETGRKAETANEEQGERRSRRDIGRGRERHGERKTDGETETRRGKDNTQSDSQRQRQTVKKIMVTLTDHITQERGRLIGRYRQRKTETEKRRDGTTGTL